MSTYPTTQPGLILAAVTSSSATRAAPDHIARSGDNSNNGKFASHEDHVVGALLITDPNDADQCPVHRDCAASSAPDSSWPAHP